MVLEALVLLAAVVAVWWYFIGEKNPVDKLPGPSPYPIIGNYFELSKFSSDGILDTLSSYMKQYGERFKFQIFNTRIVNVAGPQDIEVVLKQSKDIKKSLPYFFLTDWLGAGLLLSSGSRWHNRRKILTPTFHLNILKNFAPIIEEKVVNFVNNLKEKNGAEVELLPAISDLTLYTICETAMGTKLDDHSSATLEYKNAVLHLAETMMNRLVNIWLRSDFIFKFTPEGKRFYKDLAIAQSFADKVIMDRKANRVHFKPELALENDDDNVGTKKRMAMLDLLLEAEEKGEIDMAGIREEVNTFMFAGHDTTSIALTFAIMLLANYEEVQERLYEECINVLGDRKVTVSDIAEMKYLEAVIKETLRLYPSAPAVGRQAVEDFMLGDILIKKGTTVDVHIYLLHRREDLYPEAEKFKPERFLSSEQRHPYAFIPFSAGLRNCIGQKFAMQEMKLALSEIVRTFKLVPKVPGFRPRLRADLVLRPIDPVYVKFVQRIKI